MQFVFQLNYHIFLFSWINALPFFSLGLSDTGWLQGKLNSPAVCGSQRPWLSIHESHTAQGELIWPSLSPINLHSHSNGIYIKYMHITWILQLTYVRHGVRLAKITLVFLQSMFYCIKEGRVCNDPIKWNNHNRHLPIIDHLKRFTNINSTARMKDRSTGNIL